MKQIKKEEMKVLKIVSTTFIVGVSLIFLAVAMGSLMAPERVMDYLNVQALSDSALSSIRSYYGGLNLALAIFLFYAAFNMRKAALAFIALYSGGFLFGRIYSVFAEGIPSAFVIRWTTIEFILMVVSFLLVRAMISEARNKRMKLREQS